MKRIIIISIVGLFCSIGAVAQLYSPYVELLSTVINNTGFKPASLRSGALSRPTPMHIQSAAPNTTIPARFVVAKVDVLGTGTWAWANGWTTAANALVNGGVAAAVPTGCAAYFELGGLVGTWRVPTQREMSLIMICRHELGALGLGLFTPLGLNTGYWMATQQSATSAWTIAPATTISAVPKTSTGYAVRCVRDI